jgi:lysozyme
LPVEAVNLVKHFEGLKLTRYYCPSGKLTIGYGHTGKGTRKQKITIPEAEKLLEQDLSVFQKVVTNNVKVPLTNSQFGALVSFSFNVGEGAFKKSTVLKKLNSGNYKLASQEMLRWTRDSRKRILPGLVRRRAAEVKLFLVET